MIDDLMPREPVGEPVPGWGIARAVLVALAASITAGVILAAAVCAVVWWWS